MGRASKSKICSHNMSRTTETSSSADGLLSHLARRVVSLPPWIHLLFIIPVSMIKMTSGQPFSCGDFINMQKTAYGSFQTPEIETTGRCIWLMETSRNTSIHLQISFKPTAGRNSSCQLIEIRDGGPLEDVLLEKNCERVETNITSKKRWVYVRFESEGAAPAGVFQLSYSPCNKRAQLSVSPLACAAYQFECEQNKYCLSYSYVCDSVDDCGCGKPNVCDEEGCTSEIFGFTMTVCLGLALSLALAIPVVAAGVLLEKRHNWEKIVQTSARWTSAMKEDMEENDDEDSQNKSTSSLQGTLKKKGGKYFARIAGKSSQEYGEESCQDVSIPMVPTPEIYQSAMGSRRSRVSYAESLR